MSDKRVLIKGGKPLKGTVYLSGSRDSAIKLITASLLICEDVFLDNVPEVGDVFSLVELVKELGVSAEWVGTNKLFINASGLSKTTVPKELDCEGDVASLMASSLLTRFGEVYIPNSVSEYAHIWESLGASICVEEGRPCRVESKQALHSATISFEEDIRMSTESAIVSSVLVSGETLIHNVAQEPEVDDLIGFLNACGAKVERISDKTIKVIGVGNLSGASWKVMPDRNEAVAWAVAAVCTHGDITIENICQKDIVAFLSKLRQMGVHYEVVDNHLRVWSEKGQELTMPEVVQSTSSLLGLLMTQADGVGFLRGANDPNEFEYTKELNRMGAKIKVVDASAKITGPTVLGGRRVSVSDPHSGTTLVVAALMAEGKSEVFGADIVEQSHENFFEKVQSLGGDISACV